MREALVVADAHAAVPAADEAFQPLQRLRVDVVGGLVEQQDIGLAQQQRGELQLDLLAARERAYALRAVPHALAQAERALQRRERARRGVRKRRAGAEKFVHGLFSVRRAQLLRQVADRFALRRARALGVGIGRDERGIIDPLEQRRLAVALLADDDRLVPAVEHETEIVKDRAQILPVRDRQMVDLKHKALAFPPRTEEARLRSADGLRHIRKLSRGERAAS